MSRRKTIKRRNIGVDPLYSSPLLQLVANRLMKKGKKTLAYKILYLSLEQIRQKTKQDALIILEQAIRNATPLVEVKARRIGGSVYQVPREVETHRGQSLAIRWILTACRKRSGKSMVVKLTNEVLDAAKQTGEAIKKREETHRMADANKAFARYRF